MQTEINFREKKTQKGHEKTKDQVQGRMWKSVPQQPSRPTPKKTKLLVITNTLLPCKVLAH